MSILQQTPSRQDSTQQILNILTNQSRQNNDLQRNFNTENSNPHNSRFLSPKSRREYENGQQSSGHKFITPKANNSSKIIFNQSQSQSQLDSGIVVGVIAHSGTSSILKQSQKQQSESKPVDLLNIKNSKNTTKVTASTASKNQKAKVEVGKGSNKKPQQQNTDSTMNNTSFKYSDIADELDYELDEIEFQDFQKRFFSPQNKKRVNEKIQAKDKNYATANKTGNRSKRDLSFGLSSEDDLSNSRQKGQSKRYLDTEINKKSRKSENESKLKNGKKQGDLKAPLKGKLSKVIQSDNEEDDRSPSAERRKRLSPSQFDSMYTRMMQYEQRKQKTIKMMKEAKLKEEELELEENLIHNNKQLTKEQQLRVQQRLYQDAERRKKTQIEHQRQNLIIQEEQMKELFKPKINNNYLVKRENIFNENGSTDTLGSVPVISGQMTLEQKIVIFQNEASSRQQLHNQSTSQLNNSHQFN